jgi:hypothetical protein
MTDRLAVPFVVWVGGGVMNTATNSNTYNSSPQAINTPKNCNLFHFFWFFAIWCEPGSGFGLTIPPANRDGSPPSL